MNNAEFSDYIKHRSKQFALRVIKVYQHLPKNTVSQVIGKQLLRSGTSAAANYRAACRARSDRESYAKTSIVIEELDESIFWMELLIDSGIMKEALLKDLLKEALELLKITATARKTTGKKINRRQQNP